MAGYSGKTLLQKLGLASGMTAYFQRAPGEYFRELGDLPKHIFVEKLEAPVDFWHAFYISRDDLEADIPKFKHYLPQGGMLWVSWPKRASGVKTDLTEQTFREVLLPIGLVDVKVCAVTDTWSGLKFVWRRSV